MGTTIQDRDKRERSDDEIVLVLVFLKSYLD